MLYTHCVVPENTEHDYTSYSKIRILSPLGIEPTEQKPRLYLTEEERRKAREILASLHIEENTPFITLDATHKHPKRRWKYYGELVRRILADYPQFVFFVIRAPNEDEQVRHLLDIDPERVRMPANPLSLRETMACFFLAFRPEKSSERHGKTDGSPFIRRRIPMVFEKFAGISEREQA